MPGPTVHPPLPGFHPSLLFSLCSFSACYSYSTRPQECQNAGNEIRRMNLFLI